MISWNDYAMERLDSMRYMTMAGFYIRKSPGIDQIGSILVTGPCRDIMRASRFDLHFATPFGDMMFTGCFGLVDGYLNYVSKQSGRHEKRIT